MIPKEMNGKKTADNANRFNVQAEAQPEEKTENDFFKFTEITIEEVAIDGICGVY